MDEIQETLYVFLIMHSVFMGIVISRLGKIRKELKKRKDSDG